MTICGLFFKWSDSLSNSLKEISQEGLVRYHTVENQIINNERTIVYNTDECRGSETDMLNKAINAGYKVSKLSEKDKEYPGTFLYTPIGGIIIPGGDTHVTTYVFNK